MQRYEQPQNGIAIQGCSTDPIGLVDSSNLYVYAHNNFIEKRDTNGHETEDEDALQRLLNSAGRVDAARNSLSTRLNTLFTAVQRDALAGGTPFALIRRGQLRFELAQVRRALADLTSRAFELRQHIADLRRIINRGEFRDDYRGERRTILTGRLQEARATLGHARENILQGRGVRESFTGGRGGTGGGSLRSIGIGLVLQIGASVGLDQLGMSEQDQEAVSALAGGGIGVVAYAASGALEYFSAGAGFDLEARRRHGMRLTEEQVETLHRERMEESASRYDSEEIEERASEIKERNSVLSLVPLLSSWQAREEINEERRQLDEQVERAAASGNVLSSPTEEIGLVDWARSRWNRVFSD